MKINHPFYLKALGPNLNAIHGGIGEWPEPGIWTDRIDNIKPCVRGWHICTPVQMLSWLPTTNNDIWIVEVMGDLIKDGDKCVAEQAKLVRKLNWTNETARPFTIYCAESVLHFFEDRYPNDNRPRKAIEAARNYIDGQNDDAAAYAAAYGAIAAYGAVAAINAYGAIAAINAAIDAIDAAYGAIAVDDNTKSLIANKLLELI